ncbi:MAG TPA: ABC transporter substrate-binding protein [Methylomirabilota bacterium]|nr:ABC transporter substrate-binding protein [Methylomirabilota bacterium]
MRLLVVLGLVVAVVLGGTPAGAQAPGPLLTAAQLYNPEDMSPWNYTAVATVDIWAHFMEPLTVFDRKGELHGVVAESWQVVSPTEWIVKIRQGMRFHDPKYGELTAEDVKFTLDRAVQPAEVIRRLLPKPVQDGSVEVVDKYTIRWKLGGTGTGSLPNYMSLVHITSKAYVEGEGKETFKRRPMGTGPYRFVEWLTNQRVVGEAFPGYWGPKPGFGRVVWRILPDALTAKNALLAGEIDLYQFVPPEAIPEVQRNPKTRVVETLSARMLFMVINAAEPPLDNKLVRQALNHAVDKKTLVEQLYRGRAVALRAPMQETIPELNRNLGGYPYDPQKARDLLKQAGYRGQPIKVNTPIGRYTLDKELGEAVAGMLEKVGVTVEFKASEWGGYAQPLFSGKASGISLIGMGNTVFLPDWVFTLWLLPGGQGEVYTKGRPANWEGDVARLSLMARGNRERQALVEKLQAEALDFAPWILLVNLKDVYALSDRVVWEPYPNEMRNLKDARPRN